MYGQRKNLRSAAASSSAGAGSSGGAGTSTQQQTQGSLASGLMTDSQMSSQMSNLQVDDGSSDNDDNDGEEYGDMHRLVLQGVMAAGYLDAKGVKKLFQESCKFLKCTVPAAEHMSPPYIQKVVREINERIKHFDMMIRSATCEITGEKYYVFLVTIEKQIMKMQTYFTKVELDLFQKILDSLLRKHANFMITMNECINIGGDLDSRSFNKMNAEDFINKMITLQYLAKVFKDKEETEFEITLGFRTIREFEPIFREAYNDCFGTCCLCKMILLNGLQCPKCTTTLYHRACLKKYIKSCKMCASCKGQWKNEDSLPVRTRDGSAGDLISTQEDIFQSSAGPSTSKKSRITKKGDEVDMPILEPMVSPRSAGTSQTSKAKKTPLKSSPSNKKTNTPKSGPKRRPTSRRIVVATSSSSSSSESESE